MRRLLRRGGRSPICRALAFQVALALSDFVLGLLADVGAQCAVRSRSTLLGPPRSLAAKCSVSRPSCNGRLRVLDLDTLAASSAGNGSIGTGPRRLLSTAMFAASRPAANAPRRATLEVIQRAFELAGVELIN